MPVYVSDPLTGVSGSAETQVDGSYTVCGLPSGAYKLLVSTYDSDYADEYYNDKYDIDSATVVVVKTGQTISDINFSLETGCKITGTVTDKNGDPMPGVPVYAYQYSTNDHIFISSSHTFSDGSYEIAGLSPGSYRVQIIEYGDYVAEYYHDAYDLNLATAVSVELGQTISGIDFSLEIGGKITGRVTYANGCPIPGSIWIYAYDCNFDSSNCNNSYNSQLSFAQSDGSYIINGLSPGCYKVVASQYRYGGEYATKYYNSAYDFNSATDIYVELGQTVSDINFSLEIGAKITGIVTGANGDPVPNLCILANNNSDYSTSPSLLWNILALTGSDGTYTITGLPPGNYKVKVTTYGTDYAPKYFNNMNNFDSASDVGIGLGQTISDINFGMDIGGKISGRVTDADGKPIRGLRVSAYDFFSDYPSDCPSRYWYPDERWVPSTYTMTIDHWDWSYSANSAHTVSDGTYMITGLSPGSYRVEVSTNGTDYISKYYDNAHDLDLAAAVEVVLGQTTSNIDFYLALEGEDSGTASTPPPSGGGGGCFVATVGLISSVLPYAMVLVLLLGTGLIGLVRFRRKFVNG